MNRLFHSLMLVLIVAAAATAEKQDLNLVDKLVIYGEKKGDKLGAGVTGGDFDGDGIDDLALGAPGADGSGTDAIDAGRIYIFFGSPDRTASGDPLDLSEADVVLIGPGAKDQIGRRLIAADLDADGRDDLLIGSMYGNGPDNDRPGCGEARVLFGRPRDRFAAVYDFAENDADIVIHGAEQNDYLTGEIGTGDLNGDGYADLLLGAFYGDGPQDDRHHAGEVAIFFGGERDGLPRRIDLAEEPLPTVYGVEASDTFGRAIAGGDLDGDGRDELIVGAYYADGPENSRINCGDTFVIFGRERERFPMVMDLAEGIPHVIYGEQDGDVSGRAVAAADLNRDGRKDLIISAHSASPDPADHPSSNAGVIYVLWGRDEEELGPVVDLRFDADLRILGRWDGDHLGWPVLSGRWDSKREAVLVMAKQSDGGDLDRRTAGEAFLVIARRGEDSGKNMDADEAALFSLVGLDENDRFGFDGAIFDWNGDGRAETAVGAPEAQGPDNHSGRSGEVIIYTH